MNDRLPASLAYFLIYNPTLPAPHTTSRDDEDAQEEAHILFYTSRERVVSRDRMLRQVGLAKALVNFSEMFTPGQGCDNVHSQGKRMISVSPEPDFWMHVCVDLAKTQKPNKSEAIKGTDRPQPTYYYHEDSVHDLALRNYLLKGYESFKLLHGTYSSILQDTVPGTLESHLEHFFTPWAWHWDFAAINEFGAHLGLPLHPLSSSLSSLVSSFIDSLPQNTIPILLSPPYIIESSRPSVATCPSALPRYLLSLTSSLGGPTQPSRPTSENKSLGDSGPGANTGSTSMSSNTLGFLGAARVSMGEVMKLKNWSWTGALTFGKTGLASRNKSSLRVQRNQNTLLDQISGHASTRITKEGERRADVQVVPANQDGGVEGGVDQSALDDAISSETETVTKTELTTDSEMLHPHGLQADMPSSLTASSTDTTGCNAPFGPDSSPLRTSTSQTRAHAFSVSSVFLSEPSKPLVVRRGQVLHMSLFQLVFALVMDIELPVDGLDAFLESLTHKVSGFLEDLRKAIDTDPMYSNLEATVNPKNPSDRSRHIICSQHYAVFSKAVFTTTSSIFFESQETLARDPDMLEILSRSSHPQHWFVARRGLGFSNSGDKIPGEVYLQTNNKEASLVDADNEVVGAVRRWSHAMEY